MASCAVAALPPPSTRPATSRRSLTRAVLSRCGLVHRWAKRDSNPRPPACKAGALNQLSYSPHSRPLQRQAEGEKYAIAQHEQNRGGGCGSLGEQHVAQGQTRQRRTDGRVVLGTELEARMRDDLVWHGHGV